jgi:CheY-like chemotaxis protein
MCIESRGKSVRLVESTILLIDDDPLARMLLQRRLEHEGYRVLTASEGREGIRIARAETPNLILLDLRMPGMSGQEAIKHLRADPLTAPIAIAVYTSEARASPQWEHLDDLDFDGYLPKSLSLPDVLCEVQRLIR